MLRYRSIILALTFSVMRIPQTYTSFQKTTALVIVTDEHEAIFYSLHDGEITRKTSCRVDQPKYSDREDFGRRGSLVYESGARFESKKRLIKQDFLKAFKAAAQSVAAGAEKIFLFCPDDLVTLLQKILLASIGSKTSRVIKGNFYKKKPLELLALLTAQGRG